MDADIRESEEQRLRAFQSVVVEYEGPLLRYCTRLVRDADAAQDIVQDVFIRLFRNWREETKPSPLISNWLYRVVHNCAVDHLRKQSRRTLLHRRHSAEQADMTLPNRGAGFELSEAAEQAAACLQNLSLREQQLVILKVYEEKSYKEISDITGLTVGHVGYILHHALKKLGAELKKVKAI